jgi:hypothetical protein
MKFFIISIKKIHDSVLYSSESCICILSIWLHVNTLRQNLDRSTFGLFVVEKDIKHLENVR